MKRAVVYARYSSDRQNEQSIEGQLSVCTEYAKRNDIVITGMYIDRALTGRSDDRPEFQRMIAESKSNAFNIVLIYKFDRFSRDRYDSLYYEKLLNKNGVQLISATEPISNDPQGILLRSIIDGYSEYYSAELAQKVRRGNLESRKKGLFTGGLCIYGYRIENQRYVIDEIQASIVKRIFNEFINGKKIKDIITDLTNEGYSSPTGPFKQSRIPKMLRNKKYIGIAHIAGVDYYDMVPPIIDVKTFETAQIILDKGRQKNGREKADVTYFLSGKVYCGSCGSLMVGAKGTSKTGAPYYYYKCAKKIKNTHNCNRKPYRKEFLEKYVYDSIIERLNDSSFFEEVATKTAEVVNKEFKDTTKEKALSKELKEIEKKLSNYTKAIEIGIFNNTTQQAMVSLIDRKEKIQTELSILDLKKESIITTEDVMKYLNRFKDLDYNNPSSIRILFSVFLKAVIITDDDDIIVICNNSDKQKNEPLNYQEFVFNQTGGPLETRTPDPLIKSQLLYQLS